MAQEPAVPSTRTSRSQQVESDTVRVVHLAPDDRVLDQLPVVAYRCRPDEMWTCEYVGPGLAGLGVSPSRWVAEPGLWLRQVHPDDRERVARERMVAVRSGWLMTEYRVRTDGGDRWVHDRARVDPEDGDGGPRRIHGVLLDMTEQHDADRVVEHSFEAAAERAELLGFTRSIDDTLLRLFSHDVRSPLAAATGLVTTLLRDRDRIDEARQQELLERVSNALGRTRDLIEKLEANWDREADTAILAPMVTDIDLCGLLAEVVAEVCGPDDQVEVACDGITIRAIPALLHRAMVGMVRNALVHTPPGTHVLVAAIPRDDGTVIMVEDDGPGVPSEARRTVFEPHVRLDDHDLSGLGIGLSLVREVADLHRGRTWVEEGVTGGAVFCLFLPSSGGDRGSDPAANGRAPG